MTLRLARTLLLTGACLIPAIAGNQILLRNLDPTDGTPALLAGGTNGQIYVISTLTSNLTGQNLSRVVELDLTGTRLASFDLPQLPQPAAAITDGQGNLILAGQNAGSQGAVFRLDPKLEGVTAVVTLPAVVRAAASDSAGNVYVTGSTGSTTFPVTAGAYQSTPPGSDFHGSAAYAFLTEVSPAGKIVYSTYFGSDTTTCIGGSYCVGKFGVTTGTAIALDASGAIVIAGSTTATALPTTAGAFEPTCGCGYGIGYPDENAGFVAKFQPSATQQLQWSTYLNASAAQAPSLAVNAIAIDAAGNVIAGGNAPPGLPETPSVFQFLGPDYGGGGFLLELNSTGSAVNWGTSFGNVTAAVSGLFVDPQGQIVFSAQIAPLSYVARMSDAGTTLAALYPGPEISTAGPLLAPTSAGGFAAVFPCGALWIETTASVPSPSILNIANSATGQYSTTVSAGELVTLYGSLIGPGPIDGQVENGVFTSSLSGYQVLFNGVPAPLLFADSEQINAVVPGLVEPGSILVQLVTPAGTLDGPSIALAHIPANGVFQNSQTGLAAALNQDGSVNSPSNPAKAGSFAAIFVNAYSPGDYAPGAVAANAIVGTSLPVYLFDDSRSYGIAFAGYAPGLVDGVMQINFQLPDPLPAGNPFTFYVQIGGTLGPVAQGQIAVAGQ
ncbi:MAG TPA: hypothetical protein VMB03_26770 [Bryobacteraceae bacterium]|nr:hypothetical protein [Bryobacteraceae bacterium]